MKTYKCTVVEYGQGITKILETDDINEVILFVDENKFSSRAKIKVKNTRTKETLFEVSAKGTLIIDKLHLI